MQEKTKIYVLTHRAEFIETEYKDNDRITFEPAGGNPDFTLVTIDGPVLITDLLNFMHAGVKIGMNAMSKALI